MNPNSGKVKIDSLMAYRTWIATELLPQLSSREILLLEGDVGAGKTQLVRFLLAELGSLETYSPTFAIHHRYMTSRGGVDHVDIYRLTDEDDLESTGFWELFSAKEGLIIIEWADRLNWDVLPRDWQCRRVRIQVRGDESSSEEREVFTELLWQKL